MQSVSVDFYSDYICPWCYVGFYRLNRIKALLEEEINLIISVEPHLLYPAMPVNGYEKKMLAHKSKPGMGRALRHEAQVEKIVLNSKKYDIVPNSRLAHLICSQLSSPEEMLHFSREVFDAYFDKALDIGDQEVIMSIAQSYGLSELQKRKITTNSDISIVPTLRLDHKHLLPGLQNADIWIKYIRRAAALKKS